MHLKNLPRLITNGNVDGVLDKVVRKYKYYLDESDYDVRFKKNGPIQLTPEKPNIARTTFTVTDKDSNEEATMYAIVFLPNDGTGDESTYKVDRLKIPEYLKSADPRKIMPRKKDETKCVMEVMAPLFTFRLNEDNDTSLWEYANSLKEITVDSMNVPTCVVEAFELGVSGDVMKTFSRYDMRPLPPQSPSFLLTTGYTRDGRSFGRHHSIYAPEFYGNLLQTTGFISLSKENEELCKMFDKIAKVPNAPKK